MFPGSYFGEEMFVLNNPRSSRTFIALKDVTVCVIDKELFKNEHIFKPAAEQLAADVAARIKVLRLTNCLSTFALQCSIIACPEISSCPSSKIII